MMFRSRVALRNIIFTVTFDILIRTDSSFHDDIHNNQKYSWNHSFIIRMTLCVLLRRIMMRSGAPRWSYSTACSCQTAGATWTPQRSRLVFYCSECLNNMSWSVSSIKANATIHDFGNSKHLVVSCVSVSFTWIWMFFWHSVTHEASVKARRTSGWKQDKQTWRTWPEQRNSGPARTTQTARTIKRSHTWKWFECDRSDDDQITLFMLQIRNTTLDQREDTSTGGNSAAPPAAAAAEQNAAALFSTETERISAELTLVQNVY